MMAKQRNPKLGLALQCIASGQANDAVTLCEAALRDNKKDDLAMAMLAQAKNALGFHEEAIKHVTAAIAKNSKRADYHGLFGDLLTTKGEFRKAIGAYDKALKLNPNHHGVIAGKANTWLRLNESKKAIDLLTPLVKKGNEDLTISIVYARALIEHGEPFAAAELLLKKLPANKEPNETRRTMYFTLGKAMEQAGEYKSSFEAYTEGNKLSVSDFDLAKCKHAHNEIINVFSSGFLKSASKSNINGSNLIFIVGMLRSGSTLTEQIIDAHPNGHGLGELDTLPKLIQKNLDNSPLSTAWPNFNCEQLTSMAQQYLDLIPKCNEEKLVDKQLGNFMFVGVIKQLFPQAKIIHCTRNPISMGLSCFAQKLPPNTNPWASSLKSIGDFYIEYTRLMNHWHSIYDDILKVSYESLVQNQESNTKEILDYCDLEFDEQCLRFWETGRTVLTLSQDQVRKPMYTDSVKRHEKFGDLLAPLQQIVL